MPVELRILAASNSFRLVVRHAIFLFFFFAFQSLLSDNVTLLDCFVSTSVTPLHSCPQARYQDVQRAGQGRRSALHWPERHGHQDRCLCP